MLLDDENVDISLQFAEVMNVDDRYHYNRKNVVMVLQMQPGRILSQFATPFGGLLGSSAEEGRAKPRYYSV